jgi:DNA-binding NarL/FixJ family response regulator
LDQGVRGYVGKDRTLDYFVAAIQTVAHGDLSIPAAMTLPVLDLVLRKRLGLDLGEHRFTSLTSREREVLYFLAKGRSTTGIASVMTISPQTVRTHVQNIFAKLEVRSRIAAVAFAAQEDRMERLASAMRVPSEESTRRIFAGHCP